MDCSGRNSGLGTTSQKLNSLTRRMQKSATVGSFDLCIVYRVSVLFPSLRHQVEGGGMLSGGRAVPIQPCNVVQCSATSPLNSKHLSPRQYHTNRIQTHRFHRIRQNGCTGRILPRGCSLSDKLGTQRCLTTRVRSNQRRAP